MFKFKSYFCLFLLSLSLPVKGESLDPFEELECLKPSINFWESIYTKYGKDQLVFFHDRTFEIYKVIDLPLTSQRSKRYKVIKSIVVELRKTLTDEQLSHIRIQIGVKERFEKGIVIGKKLVPQIQDQLTLSKIPLELAMIPLVESSFQFNALSKAGAKGPWQIMPGTLKMYSKAPRSKLNDLKFSTKIAILILKDDYEATKTWPLAINSYNSGIGRLVDAEKRLKTTNICTIIDDYGVGAYRFASRNYYSQFLAAKRIYYNTYFPNIKVETKNKIIKPKAKIKKIKKIKHKHKKKRKLRVASLDFSTLF